MALECAGPPPGDLYVFITIRPPHKVFERQGDNLFTQVKINMTQAALGTETDVPILGGTAKLTIPPRYSKWHSLSLTW